jgi:hypothetical protein
MSDYKLLDGRSEFAVARLRRILRGASPNVGLVSNTGPAQEPTRCTLGVRPTRGVIEFSVGEARLELTPDQADQLSADLRQYSLELRNGGRFE